MFPGGRLHRQRLGLDFLLATDTLFISLLQISQERFAIRANEGGVACSGREAASRLLVQFVGSRLQTLSELK